MPGREKRWKTKPKGNETNGFFPLWEPLSSLRRLAVASLAAIRGMALSPPTGSRRSCSRSAAHRKLQGIPERCSLARVRFAAPKTGAPLPAPRRSGGRHIATGGSDGNTIELEIRSMKLNSKTKERKSAATRPLQFSYAARPPVGTDFMLIFRLENARARAFLDNLRR